MHQNNFAARCAISNATKQKLELCQFKRQHELCCSCHTNLQQNEQQLTYWHGYVDILTEIVTIVANKIFTTLSTILNMMLLLDKHSKANNTCNK